LANWIFMIMCLFVVGNELSALWYYGIRSLSISIGYIHPECVPLSLLVQLFCRIEIEMKMKMVWGNW